MTGPSSERTADADAAIVEKLLRIGNQDDQLLSGRSYRPETWDEGQAALDRLVAQHRDTQGSLHPDVYRERRAQEQSWGKQEHPDEWWLAILVEEVGEAAQGVLHERFGGDATCRYEVVQIAAVALAWLEWMDELAALASVPARTPE